MATATSFSPARSIFRPSPNPPKAQLSPAADSCRGNWVRCCPSSLSATANYARVRDCAFRVSGLKPLMSARLSIPQKRAGFVRCALSKRSAEKSTMEEDVKQRMEQTIDTVRSNFNSIRTGRASPAMLDKVEMEYYGTPVSLKSLAQISTPDAGSLMVQPYDKSSLKAIEKAIVSSDLGLSPNNDGEVIRLDLPQLTAERRKLVHHTHLWINW